MAGPVCKIIINQGVGELSKSIATAMMHPLVRGSMLAKAICDDVIQALADFDVRTYTGVDPMRRSGAVAECMGLKDILTLLAKHDVITDEVFEVFG